MRYKFLKWLKWKVFKVPEGEIPPKPLLIIYRLLFPLNWLYERQSHVKYRMYDDCYIIRGVQVQAYFFDCLSQYAEEGRIFKFVKNENGKITLELIERWY